MRRLLEQALQRGRRGEPLNWHESSAVAAEVDNLRQRLEEVHAWIVCAGIATTTDMMQNAARIEEITRPEWKK